MAGCPSWAVSGKIGVLLLPTVALSMAMAQEDPLQDLNRRLKEATHDLFGISFEQRTRWEQRSGVNFGKDVNQQDMLSRLRIGAELAPAEWLQIHVMGQDSRVPFYGVPAPNTLRDTMDLQEAYTEFFPGRKTGFGASAGRQMLNYGEARLIGVPQWSNVARTYDNARVYYRTANAHLELLMVSPVKVLPDQFNRPELGERIWGMYNTFSSVWHGASIDLYALRHSQNRIGGWTGAGTLGTNSFGGRLYGSLPDHFIYSLEGVGQTGHLGLRTQRAYAWFSGLSRMVTALNRPLNLSVEYKLASGTGRGGANSSTFDQLSPANHDKFGHEDLFGWRNLRTLRSLETLNLTKAFALNVMYTNEWLFSASDGLYNSQGKSIALSAYGTAGTHVGQELDAFLTYRYGAHLLGAGFGHFFKGEFIRSTTPNINPRYFYVFQEYSFK